MNSEDIKTLEGLDAPSPEVKSAIDSLWLTIEEAAKKLHAVRDDNAMLLAERSELEDKLRSKEDDKAKLNENLEFSEQLISEYESEINILRSKNATNEKDVERADEFEQKYYELSAKHEELESTQWLLELKSNSIPVFNLELGEQLDRISDRDKEITELKSAIKELEQSQGNFSFASQDLVRKNKELNVLNDEILKQKGMISEQQSKLFEFDRVKMTLESKVGEIVSLQQEVEKLEYEKLKLLDTFENDKNSLIEENKKTSEAKSNELKLMLNSTSYEVDEWKSRFQNIEKVYNNESESNAKKVEELIYKNESKLSKLQAEYELQINKLNEQTGKHKQVWEVQEKALEEFSVKLGKMKARIEELDSDNRELSRKKQLLSTDNEQLLAEREEMIKKMEDLEIKMNNDEEIQNLIKDKNSEIEEIRKSRSIHKEKLHFSEIHNQDLQTKVHSLNASIMELKNKDSNIHNINDELKAKSNIIVELEKNIEQLGNEKFLIEQLNNELNTLDSVNLEEINELKLEQEKISASSQESEDEIRQLKAMLDEKELLAALSIETEDENQKLMKMLNEKENSLALAYKFEKNYNELVQENGLLRGKMKESNQNIFNLAEDNSSMIQELNILKSAGSDENKKIEEYNNKILGLKSLINNKDALIEKLKLNNKVNDVNQVLNENRKKDLEKRIGSFLQRIEDKVSKE
jgi:chromosome segregation ATPase